MNADDLAFPYAQHDPNCGTYHHHGLTKREYIAIQIMSGMCADPSRGGPIAGFASYAVEAADRLIAELSGPKEGGAQ